MQQLPHQGPLGHFDGRSLAGGNGTQVDGVAVEPGCNYSEEIVGYAVFVYVKHGEYSLIGLALQAPPGSKHFKPRGILRTDLVSNRCPLSASRPNLLSQPYPATSP